MAKYIFVTGGVVSSVGKGITVASMGNILKSRGIEVSVQKLDPYLNVDPGTMSPYQHGEVFVTRDGAETDLDLGNYERFIDIELTALSNTTSGQIYSTVISKERRGDYLGGTIQVVPHVVGEIKQYFHQLAERSQADVIFVEVGGTVGDIEGQPFLEAIRQMRKDVGRDNVIYIHVTLLPYIHTTKELKTKPTQHSVNELRRIGIQPDVIICRSDYPISEGIREKLSLFCDVELEAVIPLPDVETIYEVPLILESENLGDLLVKKLGLSGRTSDLNQWRHMVSLLKDAVEPVNIALVGKYVELEDAYYSVREALCHAGLHHSCCINIDWVHSEDIEKDGPHRHLQKAQGIIIPGGFGIRGIEGMVAAATYAREKKIPFLGLCLGMQIMVIEFGRFVLKDSSANSSEFEPGARNLVIDLLPGQIGVDSKGGTMRRGNYPCKLLPGSLAGESYGVDTVYERHRHRFEFNNQYRDKFEQAGMVYSGVSPDGKLVEICEIKHHPWMVGAQFHPEFLSRPNRPHPLFCGFVGEARKILREGAQPTLPLNQQ